jgi:hydrogenase maturation protease
MAMDTKRDLILGVGSPHAEDQLGWQVVQALGQAPFDGVAVRLAAIPADLLDWLDGVSQLHVCDACRGAAREPTLHRWQWPDRRIACQAWSGTHDLSLPGVLELATELKLAPPRIIVWGLEMPLAERDDAAARSRLVDQAARRIADEVRRPPRAGKAHPF